MRRINAGLIMAAAMAACGSLAQNVRVLVPSGHEEPALDTKHQPSRTVQIGGDSWHPTYRGPGWTVAQVKRMARKQRNSKQHRLACRRNGGRKS